MNNYGIFEQRELHHKQLRQEPLLDQSKFNLNHVLNMIGVAVFWIYMIALLISPVWVPWLVNQVLAH